MMEGICHLREYVYDLKDNGISFLLPMHPPPKTTPQSPKIIEHMMKIVDIKKNN